MYFTELESISNYLQEAGGEELFYFWTGEKTINIIIEGNCGKTKNRELGGCNMDFIFRVLAPASWTMYLN